MALTPETEAQILRYHHAERWPIGTIATQLQVHRDSVARVLAQAGLPPLGTVRRPRAIDPYLPFILETLTQFPRLRASRLYDMVKDRGYPGRPDHFRRRRKRICACAPCPANRCKLTGATSVALRSDAPAGP